MKTEETFLEKMKKMYGLYEGSPEFIPRAGKLLELKGQQVVLLTYSKNDDGSWSNSMEYVTIVDITDFDPITITYLLKYKISDTVKEVRIIPEGFSFENPEDTGKSMRFIPLSNHFNYQEKVKFYDFLREKFETAETLSIEQLNSISQSKEKEKTLSYSCNISAVIKTTDDKILYFRLTNLKIKHNKKNEYSLTISNSEKKTYTFLINSSEKFYKFSYGNEIIGDIKIVDISKL